VDARPDRLGSRRALAQVMAVTLAVALIASFLATLISSNTASANNVVTTAISNGGQTTCAIRTGGAAYCWGDNTYGQLGNGTTTSQNAPTPVTGGYDWASISTSDATIISSTATTCGITTANAAYCWGDNSNGEVGDGSTSHRLTPTPVSGSYTWASISVGAQDVCGVTTSGAGYCWGYNTDGENGNGSTAQHTSPVPVSGGYTWASISVGTFMACGVTTANAGYCWGYNSSGQLGNGGTSSSSTPTAISGGYSWSAISAGQTDTCGVTTSGVGYCWGANTVGEDGNGSSSQQNSPALVGGSHTWSQIQSGSATTCGVTTSNVGYCWGWNNSGQVGDNSTSTRSSPVAVYGNLSIVSLTVSHDTSSDATSCALTTGGIAYCWGYNNNGQVGDRTTTQRTIPYSVVWVNVNTSATTAPGGEYNCAIRNGGVAYCWGENEYGQLGIGSLDFVAQPAQVSGGHVWTNIYVGPDYGNEDPMTCGITNTGAGYCWGDNSDGEVGDGTTINRTTPTLIAGGYSWKTLSVGWEDVCGITTTGAGYCWGGNYVGEVGNSSVTGVQSTPTAIDGSYTWAQIDVGDEFACGVTVGGNGYCWGDGTQGELGDNSTGDVNTPTALSGTHTWAQISAGEVTGCGVTTSGCAFCWGNSDYGELGNGSTTGSLVPTAVSGSYTWSQVNVANSEVCGLTTDGSGYCWGFNGTGGIGDGTTSQRTSPTPVSGGLVFQSLLPATGPNGGMACGLTVGGAEYCWGYNDRYQLGDTTSVERDLPVAVVWPSADTVTSIGPGGQTNCSIRNGAAYCWGDNTYGELGDGTNTNRTVPTLVSGGYMWASISSQFNSNNNFATTCGITISGTGYCWGSNESGEVGDGTTNQRTVPTLISGGYTWAQISVGWSDVCGITTSGDAYCWGANFNGEDGDGTTTQNDVPSAVSGGRSWLDISAGNGFACGVATTSKGYCWGKNGYGQLGNGNTTDRHSPSLVTGGNFWSHISAGMEDACGVSDDNTAYCWGANLGGEIGDGTTNQSSNPVTVEYGLSWLTISEGYDTTCGVTTDGDAYCWGYNGAGELGSGNINSSYDPEMVVGGLSFSTIENGDDYSTDDTVCGITTVGAEYCWGENGIDQVGDGTTIDRSAPTAVVWAADVAPNNPASLSQYQSDGTTSLVVGGSLSSATAVFGGSVSDPDIGDTDSLCIELIPAANSFTNSPTACSSPVSTGNAVKVTIGGLSGGSYKWQARTVDASGSASSWVTFNSGATAFTYSFDATPPTTGSVYDGATPGVEAAMNSGSLSSLSCNWSGFSDLGSGLASYDYSFGTTPGATNVVTWTNVSSSTTVVTVNSLTLNTGQIYFCNVRAYDNASNVSSVTSSSGQTVAPTLTLSISSTSLTLSDLYAGDPTGSTASFSIAASTDGYHGYVISDYEKQLLTAGSHTLADYPSATPTVWSGTGFGYNVSGGATCGCFSGNKFEHFGSAGSPHVPIDHSGSVSGSPITGETETVTLKAVAPYNQAAGLYTTKLVWSAVVTY
jgi:alpha-tubulin suppressor-like RCC1 family protein